VRAPAFWSESGLLPGLLAPAAALYSLGAALRQATVRPQRASVPVVCVGNAVAGGAGKTPVALSIAALLQRLGHKPGFLTRGYGGRLKGPVAVKPDQHNARDVGDEPLLLARAAQTVVAADRPAGAVLAARLGADVIVMDDGLQNPSLEKDLSFLVIDGGFGFGNGRVIPAGPLREPLDRSFARADAAVIIGPDRTGVRPTLPGDLTVLEARLAPIADEALSRRRVLAFAGIGRPEKFFETLRAMQCDLVAVHSFPDHHRYDPDEIMHLVEAAARQEAVPVTTEKDFVRLPQEARPMVRVLKITTEWRDGATLEALIGRHVPAI